MVQRVSIPPQSYRLTWREMQEFRRNQLSAIQYLIHKLGPVAHIRVLGTRFYLVCAPDVIRELLIRHPRTLHRDPFTRRVLGRIMGQGLFIAEDEDWARKRKLLQPIFHAASIRQFAATFADHARTMCVRWRPGDTLRLDQEMMGLTLRIICSTMFSMDVADDTARIGALMQAIMTEAESQLRHGLPIPEWLPTPGNRRQQRALQDIRSLFREIIGSRRAHLEQGHPLARDLLTMLLLARTEADQPLSEQEVLDECLTMFVAGHETTSVALTWTWLLLLQNPDILERVRTEVNQGRDDLGVGGHALPELPYLTQVIKESLRIYPPAAAFGRTPTEPFQINGYRFEPGDNIIVSTFTLHHLAEYYPDPDRFDPDRFRADAVSPPRYAYLPFGAGPRTCIGNAFAMLEMQVVLAAMLRSLDLSLLPDQNFVPETLVTLRPRGGIQVQVDATRL